VKLFKRGEIFPLASGYQTELTTHLLATKLKNITDDTDVWAGLWDFSLLDLMDEVEKLSHEEITLITANVALKQSK
jgi:hypothetical protein